MTGNRYQNSELNEQDIKHINSVKQMRIEEDRRSAMLARRRRVGAFGIEGHLVYFVVTGRRDATPEPSVPMSDWSKYQLETMFKGWN